MVGSVKLEELVANYPLLFHMAEPRSWQSIQAHGLLSTSALLDLFEMKGYARHVLEAERRPDSVMIKHDVHGAATLRDNQPMSTKALERCLTDGTPSDWYRNLNGRVFFWLTRDRVEGLLEARAYRDRSHLVIAFHTERLVRAHLDEITLSPINSGSTLYNAQPRGSATFLRIADYPWAERRRLRGPKDAIAELTVTHAVHDAMDHVSAVHVHSPDGTIERLG